MPEGFEKCREAGGKIRTVSGPSKKFGLKEGQYLHLCILGGRVERGEVKAKSHLAEMMEGK